MRGDLPYIGGGATSGDGLTSAWCDLSSHPGARQEPPKVWVGPMKAGKGEATKTARGPGRPIQGLQNVAYLLHQ